MTKRSKQFNWVKEINFEFEEVTNSITKPQILKTTNHLKPLIPCTGGSNIGLGVVSLQEDRKISEN